MSEDSNLTPSQKGLVVAAPGRALTEYDSTLQEIEEEDTIDLREYWRIILKRKWIILSFAFIVLTATVMATLLMRPVYKATATVQIDEEAPKILNYEGVYAENVNEKNFYTTQYQILQSRSLAKAVIDRLDLLHNPEINGELVQRGFMASLGQLIRVIKGSKAEEGPLSEEEKMARAVDRFLDRLSVDPVRNSKLVRVSFSSFDPEFSARVANALVDEYIRATLERRYNAGKEAREFLEAQLIKMQATLERSDQALQDFAKRHRIADLEKRIKLASDKLEELEAKLTEVEVEKVRLEAMKEKIAQGKGDTLDAVIQNPLINQLQEEYAKASAEYARLSAKFKPQYPALVELASRIDQLHDQIRQERDRVITGILGRYDNLLDQEKALKAAIQSQEDTLLALNERAVQYNILKREVDTNKELYDGLLQRMKEIGVAAGVQENNIAVIDRAEVPMAPYKPKLSLNALLALFLGSFGGIGLAFFLEHLDNTVRRPEDVERLAALPTLGVIPKAKQKKGGEEEVSLHSHLHRRSEISEAFRSLRTSLMFSTPEGMPKVLLVTSPGPGEGKTTTAANLAIVLAQAGSQVLLIDADLRKPRLHKVFEKPQIPGLTQRIAKKALSEASGVHMTDIEGLSVLPSGTIPPNPGELLGSAAMRRVIEDMGKRFDHIVIDSAPILGLADALVLSMIVDGVMVVAQAGSTSKEGLKYTVNRLRQVRAPLLGVVLNAIDVESPDYAYHSGYYYSYRYRYEEQETPEAEVKKLSKTA